MKEFLLNYFFDHISGYQLSNSTVRKEGKEI